MHILCKAIELLLQKNLSLCLFLLFVYCKCGPKNMLFIHKYLIFMYITFCMYVCIFVSCQNIYMSHLMNCLDSARIWSTLQCITQPKLFLQTGDFVCIVCKYFIKKMSNRKQQKLPNKIKNCPQRLKNNCKSFNYNFQLSYFYF